MHMEKEILRKYIQSLIPLPDEKIAILVEGFSYVELSRDEFLFRENHVNKRNFFLAEGFVRSFIYDNNGDEVTTNIFSAPCFTNDFLSFFKQAPASENFQTITNCSFLTMDFEKVQDYFHNYPEFREFGRMMLVTNYSILQQRMLGMIKDTAENRYRKLLANHSLIFQHVPLKIIASYLGITDSSLSRIRKEISQQ